MCSSLQSRGVGMCFELTTYYYMLSYTGIHVAVFYSNVASGNMIFQTNKKDCFPFERARKDGNIQDVVTAISGGKTSWLSPKSKAGNFGEFQSSELSN